MINLKHKEGSVPMAFLEQKLSLDVFKTKKRSKSNTLKNDENDKSFIEPFRSHILTNSVYQVV